MPLIMCKCCHKDISSNAEKCPFCGEPINYTNEEKKRAIKQNKNSKIITFVVVTIILIVVFWFLYSNLVQWIDNEFLQEKDIEEFLELIFDVNIEM